MRDPAPAAIDQAVAGFDDGMDALAVSAAVRRRFAALPSDLSAAAVSQAVLRRRGRAKFGPLADRMWFTADGLEQATRTDVAAHRAARFGALTGQLHRPPRVADLCCGVGGDLLALAAAGCDVTGFDRDPATVEAARANLLSAAMEADVQCLDVETLGAAALAGFDAAFIDPSRRRDGRRTFDADAYSPAWSFVSSTLAHRSAAAKVAPGIPHDLVPPQMEVEWVSFGGRLKEAVVWSGELTTPGVRRRATLLPSGATMCAATDTDERPARVGSARRYLYEPDDAVVRAHLVADLAHELDGALLDASTAYVTSDVLVETPFAQAFEIVEVLPFSLKRLRSALRERQVGSVAIMKRGSAVDVEQLRRDLRLSGAEQAIVVLALIDGRHHAVLARPASGVLSGTAKSAGEGTAVSRDRPV
jgi:SAM-dependent methyltransferase